jgi:hypothetical protein
LLSFTHDVLVLYCPVAKALPDPELVLDPEPLPDPLPELDPLGRGPLPPHDTIDVLAEYPSCQFDQPLSDVDSVSVVPLALSTDTSLLLYHQFVVPEAEVDDDTVFVYELYHPDPLVTTESVLPLQFPSEYPADPEPLAVVVAEPDVVVHEPLLPLALPLLQVALRLKLCDQFCEPDIVCEFEFPL